MGADADGQPPAILAAEEAEPDPEPELASSRDFRITDAHGVGRSGLKEKARDNCAAIRALKIIEADGREATEAEKAALVRYSGWGALPNVFHPYPPPEWEKPAAEVRKLLTDEEYESARASTPNAHFTSPLVITALWKAVERLGLAPGAQILEPSMGVGHFFGLQPDTLLPGCKRTGVELDGITARIAQLLYPDARIFAQGFEETGLPDNFFDAVIGNIPFGNYPVYDPACRDRMLTRAIHDYFLAKSTAKTRPGGIVALITSRYTMDKQDASIRRHLASQADLVGAIRLPNTAFKENAGTEVTTDILFLQKRGEGLAAAGASWEKTVKVETPDGPAFINEYFARHPAMMLGELRLEGMLYRAREPTLTGTLTQEMLDRAVLALPEGICQSHPRGRAPPRDFVPVAPADLSGVKDGAFVERNGAILIRRGDGLDPVSLSSSVAGRVRGMIALRDAVRASFQVQLDDAPDDEITAKRAALNRVYDAFVARHGPVSSRENVKAFAGDPDQPLLLALEIYDPETKTARKTAVFERRTLERCRPVEHVDTAAEALAVSLNETGGIDWPRMEQLAGRTERQLQRELGALVYRNPEGGLWETADRYLSGDVRAKLKAAEAAAALDASYARGAAALKEVQPPDLEPGEIEARLGSSWIPEDDVREFIAALVDIAPTAVKVAHAPAIATWTVEIGLHARGSVGNTTTHGTTRFTAAHLIDQALNGRTPTAYDELDDGSKIINQQETIAAREKQQQIKDRFRTWVWEEPERSARLARDYNDRFNNLRLRVFDGAHLTLPGMAREHLRGGDLAKHQKDAVWRILQTGSTLMAHVVGAGKTYCMAAAAMELRRMGLASKPMIVVPNHLVEQTGTAFLRLYPQARLFIAGKEHFAEGRRQQAMARIAGDTWDAVIVSHRSFEFLPVSDKLFRSFIDRQVALLEDAIIAAKVDDSRRLVKELEKAKKRFVAKLKDRANRESKDDTLSFEELGIDWLFVDEADLYKNLFYATKMSRIAGLPNTDSNRAFDMYMKTRYIRQMNGGRGVVFSTGTPVSNTMAEMYTMQRYLAPELLKAWGVEHFDAWAAQFAEAVTALELAPDGSGYRMHTRFARFINLPELLSMFRSVADVQTAAMLDLPRPAIAGGRPQVVAAPASPDLKDYIKALTRRAEKLRRERIDPSVDNMLKITGDGRKAALDMRLVGQRAPPDSDTKLGRAIQCIHDEWKRTDEARGTQLVFCDLSTPGPGRFNVYDELRLQLVRDYGIPEREIAFIHDADTDAAKQLLFDAVNAGRVRILIGSTEKMGAGTNVQRRLIALHHLDAPWRPRDIEQREGRILRQGNLNDEVRIYRYVTEGSFDAYMWQTLETKARFIAQVMTGGTSVRAAEDLEGGALTYAEIKAIASGNPAVMEKVKVDTEIRKLDQLRSAHIGQQHRIRMEMHSLPEQIVRAEEGLARIMADIATRDAQDGDGFAMTVGGRVYAGPGAREEAGRALIESVLSRHGDPSMIPHASFRGFEILSRARGAALFDGEEERVPELYVRGAGLYTANLSPGRPGGTIQSIEHTLRALEKLADEARERAARLRKSLADYRAEAGKPFEHEARMKELLVRQTTLNAALDLDKGERQVAPEADGEAGPGGDEPSGQVKHSPEPPRRGGSPRRNVTDDPDVGEEEGRGPAPNPGGWPRPGL